MSFSSLWPLFLLISIPALIVLYILKRKHKEVIISSSFLWNEVYKNTRANTPWEKLRKNIMLLLQAIILLSIILALMKPFINYGGKVYKNVVIVIDNTASMSTVYGEVSRLEKSKDMAKKYINSTKEGTNTYIISYDGNSNLLLNGDFNKEKSEEIIDSIKQTYGSGDIKEVITFVSAIGNGIEESFETMIFTDKNISLGDINGKIVCLANDGNNASVDNVSHKFVEDEFKVIATITNRGSEIYEGDFSLYDGEKLVAVESLNLSIDESKTLSFNLDNINGEYLKGQLSRKDLIEHDNWYYHVLGEEKVKKILLITQQNVFLEKALKSIVNSEVYKTNDPSNISSIDDYDLYVFDNITPEIIPSKGSLLFINPLSNELFNIFEGGEGGKASVVKGEVSKYLEDTQFTLSNYNTIDIPYYGKGLLSVEDQYVGFKGELNNRKIVALSFELHNSDFVLKKEFPIFIYELGEELVSSKIISRNNYNSGEEIVIKSEILNGEISIEYPSGNNKSLQIGNEVDYYNELGIYKIKYDDKNEIFSVNFPTSTESDTKYEILQETVKIVEEAKMLKRGINISSIFILLAMMIVAFEWIMYRKGN